MNEQRIFAVLVDNEPGVLARVVGLFSGRGYNIESLTVTEVDHEANLSRITILTSGTLPILEQIKAQLERLVPIRWVKMMVANDDTVVRELALIKVKATGEKRVESMRLGDVFRAKVLDSSLNHLTFEIIGKPEKIDAFHGLIQNLGECRTTRTGVIAMSRNSS